MQRVFYPIIGNELTFPFYLSGIGISDPEYAVVREKGLISHQLLFTLEGEGEAEIDGKIHRLNKDTVMYLSPSLPHKYRPASSGWKTAWLVFRGDDINNAMKRLGFSDYFVCKCKNSSQLISIFNHIHSLAQSQGYDVEKCSALIYELVLKVRRLLICEDGASAQYSKAAEKAIAYTLENFRRDISLDDIAASAGVSSQYLCRVFKGVMNMRPIQYLTKCRISEAKALLLHTDKSITEIAEEIGYTSVTYFGMVFRKYEGISPSEFRNSGFGI